MALRRVGGGELAGDRAAVGQDQAQVFAVASELEIAVQFAPRRAAVLARGEDQQPGPGLERDGREVPPLEIRGVIGQVPASKLTAAAVGFSISIQSEESPSWSASVLRLVAMNSLITNGPASRTRRGSSGSSLRVRAFGRRCLRRAGGSPLRLLKWMPHGRLSSCWSADGPQYSRKCPFPQCFCGAGCQAARTAAALGSCPKCHERRNGQARTLILQGLLQNHDSAGYVVNPDQHLVALFLNREVAYPGCPRP